MRYLRIFVILIILISSFFILQVVKDKETISNIAELTTKTILTLSSKATSVLASISVNVDIDFPVIFIDSPKNITYNYNNSIELNFTIIDTTLDTIYYNIDDGTNISIGSNTTFSVNETTMGHTLTLYANDSNGQLNSSSVTFSINISAPWNITFTEFTGGTTNFSALNKSQQADIKEAILENPEHGKIAFNATVIIERDINLDKHGNISFNRIEIEGDNIPEFDKPALIYLYNITFSNPRPLRDGEICPSTVCTEINYSNNIFVFNVTGFDGVYSSEETTVEAVTVAGAPGGGAGGARETKISDFIIDKKFINVSILPGETKREFIRIKNVGITTLDLTIDIEELGEFIIFPTGIARYKLRLAPDEEQQVQLIFTVSSDQEAGVYPGKVIISSPIIKKIIPVSLEVESPRRIFDVAIRLSKDKVPAGSRLETEIRIFNLGNLVGRVDTQVEFGIKDLTGKIITKDETRVAVETQSSFVETIKIPSDLEPGNYIFYAIVTFDGEKGTASELFEVLPRAEFLPLPPVYIYIISGFILIIIGFLILEYLKHHYKKEKLIWGKPSFIEKIIPKPKKKFDINKLLREAEKEHGSHKKILESQLKILKQNYELGLIGKEEYLRRKRKIEKKL